MSPKPESFVVFSHGFGVDKTDRGLFNDILISLHGLAGVMFNYNELDEASGNMTVRPLSRQADALRAVIATLQQHDELPIDLICHSQGCVVAAMVLPQVVNRVIMLCPPLEFSSRRSSKNWSKRPGSVVNIKGESRLARTDGSTTIVPKEYWAELDDIKPIELFNELASKTELMIIVADQDEVHPGQKTTGLSKQAKIVHLNGDHNFSSEEDRAIMIDRVKQILKF